MMSGIDGRKEECKYLLNCSLGYSLEVENVHCFVVRHWCWVGLLLDLTAREGARTVFKLTHFAENYDGNLDAFVQ